MSPLDLFNLFNLFPSFLFSSLLQSSKNEFRNRAKDIYTYSKTKWAFSSGASVTAFNGPQERISHQQRQKECMYVCIRRGEKKRKKEIRFKQLFPTRKFLFLSPLLLPCSLQDDFTLVAPPTVHCFSILYCTYSEGGVGKSKAKEEL